MIHIFLSISGNVKSWGAGSGALRGPAKASGASKGLGLFDPRGFPWSLSWDQSIGASKAWSFYAGCFCSRIEVIFLNELADPLGMEILEL